MVFPGGKMDPSDVDPGLRARSTGAEGLDAEAVALRVAAIRETFEECGVLLARPRGCAELVSGRQLRELVERHRRAVHAREIRMAEVAEREDLELACDVLVPFAHWITPEMLPRRFDTHFFVVAAPGDQVAQHDGVESVDSLWIEPTHALEETRGGRRTMMPPTLLNLQKLGRSRNVAEALERARREPIVTVLPRVESGPDGPQFRIPPEAGYDLASLLPNDAR
jgi:8-oxo-dGTP pyrophosphatase MutT (NUDIX family)